MNTDRGNMSGQRRHSHVYVASFNCVTYFFLTFVRLVSFTHVNAWVPSCHITQHLLKSFFLSLLLLGTIDAKELKVAMRALGFEPKKEEIKKMISGEF